MRKILLLALTMTFVTACTDYKAQINDAHEEFSGGNVYVNKTGIPCGDLWCGPAKQKKIDTGESKGHWGSYVDNSDGGNSYFTWLSGETTSLSSAMAEKMTDAYLRVGGNFSLGDGYKYAYASVIAEFGRVTDASAWGGVCIVYYSTAPVRLYLSFATAADYGYDMPYVDLPATPYSTLRAYGDDDYEYELFDATWDQFVQEGWYQKPIRSVAAASELSALDFQFKNSISISTMGGFDGQTAGTFSIYSIGRFGTCRLE